MKALQELRELRNTIKACEARIDKISDQATKEALSLAPNGGEFTDEGHTFQLQRTNVINMSNFKRYKGKDAQRWREKANAKANAKAYTAALTKEILETYTVGLLEKNTKEKVFDHFNNVFGIFLNKLVPEAEHYKLSKSHKNFKKNMDKILDRPETEEDKKWSEDVKFAAYLLAGDILQKELGMTADTANLILNKRLGLITPVMDKKDEEAKWTRKRI